MSHRRTIAVVTTSRADFGYLRELIREIQRDRALGLQVIVSGMHLTGDLGHTADEVAQAGIAATRRIPMLLASDDPQATAKSIGTGLISFADALAELRPDLLVLLGDRFEILAPAIAALVARIPIAHLHGGETSQGAIDEAVRHAVTKMATYHFPATAAYAARIVQLGEPPERVFVCGTPVADALRRLRPLSRRQLAASLGFDLDGRVAIVTYHPVTLEPGQARRQVRALLAALDASGLRAVITAANADPEGRAINDEIARFAATRAERFHTVAHLGHERYLSCLARLDLMVGNSSSGLIEAPVFRLPVVNVGDRQRGRVRAANVIDVGTARRDILHGIQRALSPDFRHELRSPANPYDPFGDGRNAWRVKERLKAVDLSASVLKKPFHDLASAAGALTEAS